MPTIEHRSSMETPPKTTKTKIVSFVLSGAELADLDLSSVELFYANQDGAATRVELRAKTGMAFEAPCFSSSAFSSSSPFCNDEEIVFDSPTTTTTTTTTAASWEDGSSSIAHSPTIVLKSRSVIEEERTMAVATKKTSTKKQRAESLDESSLRLASASAAARRPPKSSQPLPLPLPPPDLPLWPPLKPAHRRHASIDLRSSSAAKFLLQLMPWEVPQSPADATPSLSPSPLPNCFVPFKWEEVPGRPKPPPPPPPAPAAAANSCRYSQRPLRLPPRLLLQHPAASKDRTGSPTSILEPESGSCSSSSPPLPSAKCETRTIHGKVKAFFARHVWDLVLGRKNGECRGCDASDPFEVCSSSSSRRRRMRVSQTKKTRGAGVRDPEFSSLGGRGGDGGSSSFPSPAVFSWFDSPMQRRTRSSRQWATRKIAATCSAIKRVTVALPRRQRSSELSGVYRPLLCRVDADSAAFACST